MKKKLLTVLTIMLICFLLFAGAWSGLRHDQQLRPVSEQVLRFRILAEDHSPEAQENKIAVRDAILNLLGQNLPAQSEREEIVNYISQHKEELSAAARNVLPEGTGVSLELTQTYFPAKTYGSLTFPQGKYEALLVRLGEAQGNNWWCCLYPQLCFTDAVNAVVTGESEQKLRNVLDEEDFSLLEGKKEVKFRLLEWAEKLFHG